MYKWLPILLLVSVSHTLLADDLVVRDPTTPLGHVASPGAAAGESALVLDSVFISSKRKLAVINGETLKEGQSLPGNDAIKIQRILPQTVVLQQGDKTWVLKMSPSIMKKH